MTSAYYNDGGITLYQGACEDILPTLPSESVDLVFTSPPYNLGNTTGGGFARTGHYSADAPLGARGNKAGKWSGGALADGYGDHGDNMPHDEYVEWQKTVLRECWRLLGPAGAIFYNHKPRVLDGLLLTPLAYNPDLPVRQIIVWARAGGVNFAPTHYCPTHEWIVVFAKPGFRLKSRAASGVGDVWRFAQASGTEHPAPFPIELPSQAIETTGPSVVLDPFAGSGTTLRAAKDAGARAIGIELNPRYCDMAVRRLGQECFDFGEAA